MIVRAFRYVPRLNTARFARIFATWLSANARGRHFCIHLNTDPTLRKRRGERGARGILKSKQCLRARSLILPRGSATRDFPQFLMSMSLLYLCVCACFRYAYYPRVHLPPQSGIDRRRDGTIARDRNVTRFAKIHCIFPGMRRRSRVTPSEFTAS